MLSHKNDPDGGARRDAAIKLVERKLRMATADGNAEKIEQYTAQLVEQGKMATDAAKEQLVSIASMLAGQNVTLKQAADLFQHAADNDEALLRYIKAIDKRLIQIQSSAAANGAHRSF